MVDWEVGKGGTQVPGRFGACPTQVHGRFGACPTQVHGRFGACPTQVHGRFDPCPTQVHGRFGPCLTQVHGRFDPCPTQVHGRFGPCLSQVYIKVWEVHLNYYLIPRKCASTSIMSTRPILLPLEKWKMTCSRQLSCFSTPSWENHQDGLLGHSSCCLHDQWGLQY